QQLVSSVNTQRRTAYASLAEKNGVSPEIAGQATFEKRYPQFPVGTWVKIQERWMQK
ncbi:MAG: YdbL family protein, partial [Chlorobiales bacterium]|nr:YdbL family protein [Chlorobiales bacterium]